MTTLAPLQSADSLMRQQELLDMRPCGNYTDFQSLYQDQVQTVPTGSQSSGRSRTQAHCWPADGGRTVAELRNPCSVCTPSVYPRRLHATETNTENQRTCVFCGCSACMESARPTDRIETVHRLHCSSANWSRFCSVYFIIRSIWKQQFLNCVMRPSLVATQFFNSGFLSTG